MPVLDIELSDSQFLRNCNTVFTELSQKSIREKDMRGKNQWSQFLVGLLGSFTKNNQRKPTLCGEEIIKQGKAVCRIESMKELLEEEAVNCTTSLEREELNKWLHDQDKNETDIQEMQSEYKEKQEDAKVSFKAIFNVHFANLVSKEYFSIQRLIIFLLYE